MYIRLFLAKSQSPSVHSQEQDRISFHSIRTKMTRMRTTNLQSLPGLFFLSVGYNFTNEVKNANIYYCTFNL